MLSRHALATVLQSLLAAELRAARGRGNPDARPPTHLPPTWALTMRIGAGAEDGLGGNSMERFRLACVVDEMFQLYVTGAENELVEDASFGTWGERTEGAWRSVVAFIAIASSGTSGHLKRYGHTVEA